jgi:tetratricopeptide (TPR) repeat protein
MTTKFTSDQTSVEHPRLAVPQRGYKSVHGEGFIGRFNTYLAVLITKSVGSMWCAYLFGLIALISLPAAIASHDPFIIISWIAQTFLQLVLLPIIIVGQNVQAATSEEANRTIQVLAMMQLGEQQLDRRNIKSAIQCYQKAFELDPENQAANYSLGELYIQDKQLERGVDHLKRAIGPDFDYAPAEAALGLAYRLQGDQTADPSQRDVLYEWAEKSLVRAVQIDPTALDIYGEPVEAGLGALYKRQNRVDEAIVHYEKAHEIAPQKSYPIVNLAILYYMQGSLPQAQLYFEDVITRANDTLSRNSSDYWARFDRLTAALALGNAATANNDLAVILQQVKIPAHLASALGELKRLKDSPHPPDHIDETITQLENLAQRLVTRKIS